MWGVSKGFRKCSVCQVTCKQSRVSGYMLMVPCPAPQATYHRFRLPEANNTPWQLFPLPHNSSNMPRFSRLCLPELKHTFYLDGPFFVKSWSCNINRDDGSVQSLQRPPSKYNQQFGPLKISVIVVFYCPWTSCECSSFFPSFKSRMTGICALHVNIPTWH